MTDTERRRIKAICKVAMVRDIGELSDGFHTFNSLYEQRMILFAALVKAYKDKAWKSYRHEDGEYCFGGGWFIVGIDTPEGSYTYHYENKYWDMFDCIDLPRAKHWDGHTETDAETRLMSLPERKTDGDTISRQAALDCVTYDVEYTTERIKALPSLQPTCNQLATDCISRKVALDGIADYLEEYDGIDENGNHDLKWCAMKEAELLIKDLPSAQPEITDEQAIGHLQASGWMQSHDKQMYEMGLKERLADDSDSYDALLPYSQPEINCSENPNTSDVVSRKAVREMVSDWAYDMMEQEDMEMALQDVDELPPEQPEVIRCKDCALWHRAGCPMDVFTEKPEPGYFCGTAKRKESQCGYERQDVQNEEKMQMDDLREEQEERLGVAPILNPKT